MKSFFGAGHFTFIWHHREPVLFEVKKLAIPKWLHGHGPGIGACCRAVACIRFISRLPPSCDLIKKNIVWFRPTCCHISGDWFNSGGYDWAESIPNDSTMNWTDDSHVGWDGALNCNSNIFKWLSPAWFIYLGTHQPHVPEGSGILWWSNGSDDSWDGGLNLINHFETWNMASLSHMFIFFWVWVTNTQVLTIHMFQKAPRWNATPMVLIGPVGISQMVTWIETQYLDC